MSTQQNVGVLVRQYRERRGLSQLSLSIEAEISAKHLSFVETGRAQPSREVLLRLATVLDVPFRDRNLLLKVGGFSPEYVERRLESAELAEIARAVDFILAHHEPYPAAALDGSWNILRMNNACIRLFGIFLGPEVMMQLVGPGTPINFIRLVFGSDLLRPYIHNWLEVANLLRIRLLRQAADSGTHGMVSALLAEVWGNAPMSPVTSEMERRAELPVLTVELAKGDTRARLFNAMTVLGTAQDVASQELRIECSFPADRATEELLRSLASG